MIRFVTWLGILLATAVGIAWLAKYFPGHAEFTAGPYAVEMSVYFFGALLGVLLYLAVLLWRTYYSIKVLPKKLQMWQDKRSENQGIAALQKATIAMEEGKYGVAQKAAKNASTKSGAEGLAAILGAASAQAQNDHVAAKEWLEQLDDNKFGNIKTLQLAQMALEQDDGTAALSHLDSNTGTLRKTSVRYHLLKAQALESTGNWTELVKWVSDSKNPMTNHQKADYYQTATANLLNDPQANLEQIQSIQKSMPAFAKENPLMTQTLVKTYLAQGQKEQTRKLIEQSMAKSWNSALLPSYVAAFEDDQLTAQLKVVEKWQQNAELLSEDRAKLLLAAGQICQKSQIWGRAKKYFDDSIELQPSIEAQTGLAYVLRQMDDQHAAQMAEQKAIKSMATSI